MTPLEWIIIAAISFGAGDWYGHTTPVAECRQDALITTNCPTLLPPEDKSFGATTASLVSTVNQYRKCKAACTAK